MKEFIIFSTKLPRKFYPNTPNWQLFARIEYASEAMIVSEARSMHKNNGGVTRIAKMMIWGVECRG